ncbi:uncharacterized protein GIQ15_01039 [Arthroderma uncinatum]|uniref:uncharacterized protein n=1 Tax=Arthroderma uncinatum TaxID=74035 RepID=UPI00144AC9D9|nr:uncharacterized protein GIQ15_01039 [Arthroderma uncinatum]KAF3491522.1 hypothetical protein GIQ15_01039 [Arthroderma uncinatum]
MTTTPPPSSAIRTPPTPRHGPRYDNYEPYSPRRSKRIAGQHHLFSDSPAAVLDARTSDLLREQHSLRRDKKLHQLGMSDRAAISPPQSQHNSPKRRSERQDMNTRSSLSPQPKNRVRHDTGSTSLHHPYNTMDADHNDPAVNGMLPTPAKTPRKKKIEDLGPAARTLFSSNSKSEDPEAMAPRRSRSKKYTGFSLESFEADPQQAEQQAISIFTDSRDRIPEVNDSMDNPFRSQPADNAAPSTSKPSADGTKRRRLDDGSQKRDKNVDKAIRRDDGLLYVFRGKKTFRKFKPEAEEDEGDDDDLGLLASRSELTNEAMPRIRPLTRSSIKPRVLFPVATTTPTPDEDEPEPEPTTPSTIIEAEEEQVEATDRPVAAVTEADATNNPITPQEQIINPETPSSPLATGRSLRSQTIKAESEAGAEHADSEAPVPRRFSPFDRWWRGKSHSSTPTKAKKRTIEGQSGPSAKKSRSH